MPRRHCLGAPPSSIAKAYCFGFFLFRLSLHFTALHLITLLYTVFHYTATVFCIKVTNLNSINKQILSQSWACLEELLYPLLGNNSARVSIGSTPKTIILGAQKESSSNKSCSAISFHYTTSSPTLSTLGTDSIGFLPPAPEVHYTKVIIWRAALQRSILFSFCLWIFCGGNLFPGGKY